MGNAFGAFGIKCGRVKNTAAPKVARSSALYP